LLVSYLFVNNNDRGGINLRKKKEKKTRAERGHRRPQRIGNVHSNK
jgi:hypothetical protein